MNKFLLGLVFGILLGFLFARAIPDKSASDTGTTAANRPPEASVATPPEGRDAVANGATPGTSPSSDRSQSSTPGSRSSAPAASALSVPESTAPAVGAQASPSAARDTPTSGTTSPSTREPIVVPDAIKSFLEKTDTHDGLTLGQTHAKLEDEADDLAWSYQMELYLQQSFARPTKSGQPFDIRVLECRTTLCEIAGFSPLPNPTDDISAVVQYMSQQPWWDFDRFNTSAEGDASGKFLIFLRRKR
jgi:hypothetical protein